MPATNPTFKMLSPAFDFPFQPPYSVHAKLLFAALWTVARQAPLSVRFSTQRYWSGLLPGHLPEPGVRPESLLSPALAGGFFTTSATWEALIVHVPFIKICPMLFRCFRWGYSLHINILTILHVNNTTSFDITYCTFFGRKNWYYFSFQFWHLAWELEEMGWN